MAAGDISGPVVTAIGDLKGDVPTVAAAALGVGALTYGMRRLWGFFKGLAK
jgi:hypothetical protein